MQSHLSPQQPRASLKHRQKNRAERPSKAQSTETLSSRLSKEPCGCETPDQAQGSRTPETRKNRPKSSPGPDPDSLENGFKKSSRKKKTHKHKQIRGIVPDWVGGKILFMCFFRLIPCGGEKKHINKIPPKKIRNNPVKIVFTCFFLYVFFFLLPKVTKKPDSAARVSFQYFLGSLGSGPGREFLGFCWNFGVPGFWIPVVGRALAAPIW